MPGRFSLQAHASESLVTNGELRAAKFTASIAAHSVCGLVPGYRLGCSPKIRPTETLTVTASYRPLNNVQVLVCQSLGEAWSIYGRPSADETSRTSLFKDRNNATRIGPIIGPRNTPRIPKYKIPRKTQTRAKRGRNLAASFKTHTRIRVSTCETTKPPYTARLRAAVRSPSRTASARSVPRPTPLREKEYGAGREAQDSGRHARPGRYAQAKNGVEDEKPNGERQCLGEGCGDGSPNHAAGDRAEFVTDRLIMCRPQGRELHPTLVPYFVSVP